METTTISTLGKYVLVAFTIVILFMWLFTPQALAKIVNVALSPLQYLKLPSSDIAPTVDLKAQQALQSFASSIQNAAGKEMKCLSPTTGIDGLGNYGIKVISSQQSSLVAITSQEGGGTQLLQQTPLSNIKVWTLNAQAFYDCYLKDTSIPCSLPLEQMAHPETNTELTAKNIAPFMLSMGGQSVMLLRKESAFLTFRCHAHNNGLSGKCYDMMLSQALTRQGMRWCP